MTSSWRDGQSFSWQCIGPYIPFVAMTAAYLGLRYALFGQAVREGQLSAAGFSYFGRLVVRHLSSVVAGIRQLRLWPSWRLLMMTAVFWIVGNELHRNDGGRFIGAMSFFGPSGG